jgi:hypothetical protein
VKLLGRVWAALKLELKVALKTFGVAWLSFTVALLVLTLVTETHSARDAVGLMTVGVVICAVYMFWPALVVATCRSVYRMLGIGAFVGAFLSLAGVVVSLVLFRNVLFSMFLEIFQQMQFSGPCGGHVPVLALFCLAAAVLASPGSWWALIKLFLAISGVILLGSLPGVLLWLALIARKLALLASKAVSR